MKYVATFRYRYSDGMNSHTGEERFMDREEEQSFYAPDDDKARVVAMGLLAIKIDEYRRAGRSHRAPRSILLVKLAQATLRDIPIS